MEESLKGKADALKALLNPLDDNAGNAWDKVLGMLILAFPEIHWVFWHGDSLDQLTLGMPSFKLLFEDLFLNFPDKPNPPILTKTAKDDYDRLQDAHVLPCVSNAYKIYACTRKGIAHSSIRQAFEPVFAVISIHAFMVISSLSGCQPRLLPVLMRKSFSHISMLCGLSAWVLCLCGFVILYVEFIVLKQNNNACRER